MGFTPTAGLGLGTAAEVATSTSPSRLWLIRQGLDRAKVATAPDRHSGLRARAGRADAREVLGAAVGGDAVADRVLEVWAHRRRAQTRTGRPRLVYPSASTPRRRPGLCSSVLPP